MYEKLEEKEIIKLYRNWENMYEESLEKLEREIVTRKMTNNHEIIDILNEKMSKTNEVKKINDVNNRNKNLKAFIKRVIFQVIVNALLILLFVIVYEAILILIPGGYKPGTLLKSLILYIPIFALVGLILTIPIVELYKYILRN